MKSCPTCRRTYPDETLIYCLDDGSALVLPYAPEVTWRIPATRATDQIPTQVFPLDRSLAQPAAKLVGNRWFIYAAIALLSVAIGSGVVAWIMSGDKNDRPQNVSASPTPQTSTNSNQPEVSKPAKAPSAEIETPSRMLVGAWRANVSELGEKYRITFTAKADGTYKHSARNAKGETTIEQDGMWQYSEGILYQTFSNGASGKGSIEWIDDDTFELTIFENGVPAYSGVKRRFHRIR